MTLDPRLSPRLRDRALDRLDGLTTGAAALGVIATAGFGTVAAMTTHVAGVSAADQAAPTTAPDDNGGFWTAPNDDDNGGTQATPGARAPSDGGTRFRAVQPPSSSRNGSTRQPHISTGGS